MADDDARSLIERIVARAERGAFSELGARRGLVRRSDGDWDFTITLVLNGNVEHTQLPSSLSGSLEGKLRARIRPTGNFLALESGDLALLETYQEDDVRWWRVQPLRPIRDEPYDPLLRVELSVYADGSPLDDLRLPGAEGLTSEPLAFAIDPNRPDRLSVAALGSHMTRASGLIIGLPLSHANLLEVTSGSIRSYGHTRSLDLQLFQLEGEARLTADGQVFRWQSGAERDMLATIELDGSMERAVRGHAWRVISEILVREGSYRRPVKTGEIRWRPRQGGAWRSFPHKDCRGDVTFALVRDGVTVSRVSTAVAPLGFCIAATVSGARRSLTINGLGDAVVGVAAPAGLYEIRRRGDQAMLDRTGAVVNHFTLDAMWPDGTSWRADLYDPTARAGFTNAYGVQLPQAWRGCLNALFGTYATNPESGKLTLEIGGAPKRRSIARTLHGETPLYALATDIRALLASTDRLDATVRLQWIGVGEHRIEIGLYDVSLEADGGEVWPSFTDLMRLAAVGAKRVTLAATPLADPGPEYVLEDAEPNAYRMRRFCPPKGLGGPWLVYGRVDNRFRIRPRVVVPSPLTVIPKTRVSELILKGDPATRRGQLAKLLNSPHLGDNEIDNARQIIASVQPRAPLQALDLANALLHAPDTAVQLLVGSTEADVDAVLALELELNFLWVATRVQSWRDGIEAREARLRVMMRALPVEDASRYAHNDAIGVLEAILARQPALAFHVLVAGGAPHHWQTDPSREAAECVTRNGHAEDGVAWPDDLKFAARLGADMPIWVRNKQVYCWDVLAAPLVAARVAAGRIPWTTDLISALRWARLFDPVYFDRVVPSAIASLAH